MGDGYDEKTECSIPLQRRRLSDFSVLGSILDGELAQETENDLCGKEMGVDLILGTSGTQDPQSKSSASPGIQESPQPDAFLCGPGDSLGWQIEGSAAAPMDSHHHCSDVEPLQSQEKLHTQFNQSTVKGSYAVDREAHSELLDDLQNSPDLAYSPETWKVNSMPCPSPDYVETNLRQWIDENVPQGLYSRSDLNDYIMTALPIAINLTETLAGEVMPEIELGSCSALSVKWSADRFVGVTSKKSLQLCDKLGRLASLGKIMYELFSGRTPPPRSYEIQAGSLGGLDVGVDKILTLVRDDNPRSKKRSMEQFESGCVDQYHRELILNLKDVGLPVSLIDMVKNLIDCSRRDFRADESYASLDDALVDLKLVRDNPDCFLCGVGNSPTFSISSKLYGRRQVVEKIVKLYGSDDCDGLVVHGRAGVGKSSLLLQVFTHISKRDGSYFLRAKFEQAGVNPLAVIASMFDALCDAFVRDSQPHIRHNVAAELESALGPAGISALLSVTPSVLRIVSSPALGPYDQFMNRAASLSYSFQKLLEIISSHFVPIIVLLDDLQFADISTRMIIMSLLTDTENTPFFVCCYRDDDVKPGDDLSEWLECLHSRDIKTVQVENLSLEGVNMLISESLKAFPRITLPLSVQLHAKTRGNPFFLRRFIDSLVSRGLIFLSLNPPRWAWDLEKISNVEMPVSVVELLVAEMQTLSPELKEGLRVVACLGSSVDKRTMEIILDRLDIDLVAALGELVTRGFLVTDDVSGVRFSHDKVQQSAYESMTYDEQKNLHARLGLILCGQDLLHDDEYGYLLFVAATQVNLGGLDMSLHQSKRVYIGALNLRAGKRAIELSAFDTALGFFQSGTMWVSNCWSADYDLTLALHTSATEIACLLNDLVKVVKFSSEVVANAISYEEKLPCLSYLIKCQAYCGKVSDAKRIAFTVLERLGEAPPREIGEPSLNVDMNSTVKMLQNTPDHFILKMKASPSSQQNILLLEIYYALMQILLELGNPKKMPDVALKMLETTMKHGYCALSPLAFAVFSTTLAQLGHNSLAYRISILAKKLVNRPLSQRYASGVAMTTAVRVDWIVEPIQIVAENLLNGHTSGLQVGDLTNAGHSDRLHKAYVYLAGKDLGDCRNLFLQYIQSSANENVVFNAVHMMCYYRMTVTLIEGLHYVDNFPSWDQLSDHPDRLDNDFSLAFQAHNYMKCFLFKISDKEFEGEGLLCKLRRESSILRPLSMIGIFYEGLVSFHLARVQQLHHMRSQGIEVLEFIKMYSEANPATFKNKYLLLEASRMELMGSKEAGLFYQKSIEAARVNKFLHEEALASEMAGQYLFSNGVLDGSYDLLKRAADKYKSWGAIAVAKRVENEIQQLFGAHYVMQDSYGGMMMNSVSTGHGRAIPRKREMGHDFEFSLQP